MDKELAPDEVNQKELETEMTEIQLENLIQCYGNELLRLCTLILRDRALAEDALQETYIKVWKNYSGFQKRSSEKTWITRIAVNVCKNYLRNPWNRRAAVKDMEELLGSEQSQADRVDTAIDLMNAVLKLKEKYRTVILLHYYEEMPVKEICKMLGRKESTVLSWLKRAREQLKKTIGGNCDESETFNG